MAFSGLRLRQLQAVSGARECRCSRAKSGLPKGWRLALDQCVAGSVDGATKLQGCPQVCGDSGSPEHLRRSADGKTSPTSIAPFPAAFKATGCLMVLALITSVLTFFDH